MGSYSAKIQYENFRFESWAEQSGYVAVEEGKNSTERACTAGQMNSATVDHVHLLVAHVSEVLDQLQPLLNKYRIGPSLENEEASQRDQMEPEASPSLPDDVKNKPGLTNALASLSITKLRLGKETGRLRKANFGWSLTNEFSDRDKIKEYVDQLKYWNDALRETLPIQSQHFHSVLSQVRTVNNITGTSDLGMLTSHSDMSQDVLEKDVQLAAQMKLERLASEEEFGQKALSTLKPISVSCLSSYGALTNPSKTLVTTLTIGNEGGGFREIRVLLDRTDIQRTLDSTDAEVLEGRVQQLQYLLQRMQRPSASLLPVSVGYVQESPSSYILLYEIPKFADPIERPQTLYDLLPRCERSVPRSGNVKLYPLLEARVSLAQALTNGILQLHSMCWLHKSLNSDNVLLFPTADGLSLSSPLLSGFGLGRAADPGQKTIDLRDSESAFGIYQHPELRAESHRRYERRYDIYSLGLVLFEIGMWQSLHYFHSEGKSPEEFRLRIINFSISRLGHLMGKSYQQLVLLCIDRDDMWKDAEGDGKDPSNLLEIFSWKVVRRLEAINLA